LLTFLLIIYLLTPAGCDSSPIGLQDRSIIPDISFNATSYYDRRYAPSNARLHGYLGWASRTLDSQDYLQIDLGEERIVCGVATQGNRNNYEWVTQYKLRFSMDGSDWDTYKENGKDKACIYAMFFKWWKYDCTTTGTDLNHFKRSKIENEKFSP
jgi:hypothetical protein